MKVFYYGLALLLSVTLWGCGKVNSDAPATLDPGTSKHAVANWVNPAVHGGLDFGASKDFSGCQGCHGSDFAGGISKVSCLNTSGCHGVGTYSPHPKKPWKSGLITHTLVKVDNASTCAACHAKGKNLQTPILSVYATGTPGCFNSTLCHGVVGHGGDPQPWSSAEKHGANPGTSGRPGAKFSISACQTCHATPSSGQNPLFTNPKSGMPGGCSSTDCHDQNINLAHPYVWLPNRVAGITTSHATAGDLTNSCGLCHGAALNGVGGIPSAPTCFGVDSSKTFGTVTIRCHATSPALAPTGCTSCHSAVPVTGKHTKHVALAGVTCAACHNNSEFGTATHANGTVNVNLSATYQAKTGGAATPSPDNANRTCSNVSCHGGQTTPPWLTGSLVVDADCTNCHTLGTTQYNSYNSGANVSTPGFSSLHDFHTDFSKGGAGYSCTVCHDTTKLAASHFTHLETQLMEGPASATIGGGTTKVSTYNTSTRSCAPGAGCHFGTNERIW